MSPDSVMPSPVIMLRSCENLTLPSSCIGDYASIYITEDKITEFFKFHEDSAINLIHINCRSLKKNFESVKLLLSNISFPLTAMIFSLTETWLKNATQDLYSINGYTFVSHSRPIKTGGGVDIYINSLFDYKIRFDICRSFPYIECLFVEIAQLSKQNVLIGCSLLIVPRAQM